VEESNQGEIRNSEEMNCLKQGGNCGCPGTDWLKAVIGSEKTGIKGADYGETNEIMISGAEVFC